MTQKIFVPDSNIITLICPDCNASKNADVSKYKKLEKSVKLKIKCNCGSSYSVVLERRRHYRKDVNFAGEFVLRFSGGQHQKGTMTVVDISRGGIKMKFMALPRVKIGSKFNVAFHLDDKQQTLIRKEVVVRNIIEHCISAEFSTIDSSNPGDKALGFYFL